MYTVYQHWDPLRVCVVGQSYPPDFYTWVDHVRTRSLLEKIAQETEEDYQKIIKLLESFDVQVLRPTCASSPGQTIYNTIPPPPMTPRDQFVMIANTFYRTHETPWEVFYLNVKDDSWPEHVNSIDDLDHVRQKECREMFGWQQDSLHHDYAYKNIIDHVANQGNVIRRSPLDIVAGSMVTRLGRDLYFGTSTYHDNIEQLQQGVDLEFTQTRNHIVNTGGHSDGTYCPVCPGLIISLEDVRTYAETFPGWEVIYLPQQSWHLVKPFLDLKAKNQGRWWIQDQPVEDHFITFVDTWMSDWVGYVEETVFDVNMLIIDPKNVIVFNENDLVFEALSRYGVTPHVANFRHRYFWDGGIHCVTLDLHRDGTMQDFFPNRFE